MICGVSFHASQTEGLLFSSLVRREGAAAGHGVCGLQPASLGLRVRTHSVQGLLLCAPQTPRRQKRLFCRYHHGNGTPQLLIAPFKEEDEWDSPHIVRYYDVMSDEEIERIKEIAKPKVGVSAVPSWAAHSWYHGAV